MLTSTQIRWGTAVGALVVGGVLAAYAVKTLRAAPIGGTFSFCFPATNMHANAVAFENSFVSDYLTPSKPFPIFTFMVRAHAEPESHDDALLLGRRGAFTFTDPTHLINQVTQSDLCPHANGVICSSATFDFDLNGQTSTVIVDFPKSIPVTVTHPDGVKFDFGSGIPVHFPGAGATGLPLVRKDMWFRSVSISDTSLEEILFDPGPTPTDKLEIHVRMALN